MFERTSRSPLEALGPDERGYQVDEQEESNSSGHVDHDFMPPFPASDFLARLDEPDADREQGDPDQEHPGNPNQKIHKASLGSLIGT
jgi:hypothetical protein